MFKFHRNQNGANFEKYTEIPTTASEVYTFGESLVITAGKLTKCGATAVPTYIAACDYTAPASGQKPLPCYAVVSGYEFETTFSATPTGIVIGSKVTIDADGGRVTATTTSGVAEVVSMNGAAASGDKVIVRF